MIEKKFSIKNIKIEIVGVKSEMLIDTLLINELVFFKTLEDHWKTLKPIDGWGLNVDPEWVIWNAEYVIRYACDKKSPVVRFLKLISKYHMNYALTYNFQESQIIRVHLALEEDVFIPEVIIFQEDEYDKILEKYDIKPSYKTRNGFYIRPIPERHVCVIKKLAEKFSRKPAKVLIDIDHESDH